MTTRPKIILITVSLMVIILVTYKYQHNTAVSIGSITSTLINSENKITSYLIGSKRFDVPLNYQFSNALIHGLPISSNPKSVDSFSVFALLPEIEAITDANKHEFTQGGYGRKISILVRKNHGSYSLTEYLDRLREINILKNGDGSKQIPKLTNYTLISGKSSHPDTWKDLYVKNDYKNQSYFLARCKRKSEKRVSPSCFVRYYTDQNLIVEYYMHIKYLPQWDKINDSINMLLISFMAEKT